MLGKKKSVQINLKVTPELKEALDEQAVLHRTTPNDLARTFITIGIRRGVDWGPAPSAELMDEIKRLREELARNGHGEQ